MSYTSGAVVVVSDTRIHSEMADSLRDELRGFLAFLARRENAPATFVLNGDTIDFWLDEPMTGLLYGGSFLDKPLQAMVANGTRIEYVVGDRDYKVHDIIADGFGSQGKANVLLQKAFGAHRGTPPMMRFWYPFYLYQIPGGRRSVLVTHGDTVDAVWAFTMMNRRGSGGSYYLDIKYMPQGPLQLLEKVVRSVIPADLPDFYLWLYGLNEHLVRPDGILGGRIPHVVGDFPEVDLAVAYDFMESLLAKRIGDRVRVDGKTVDLRTDVFDAIGRDHGSMYDQFRFGRSVEEFLSAVAVRSVGDVSARFAQGVREKWWETLIGHKGAAGLAWPPWWNGYYGHGSPPFEPSHIGTVVTGHTDLMGLGKADLVTTMPAASLVSTGRWCDDPSAVVPHCGRGFAVLDHDGQPALFTYQPETDSVVPVPVT